MKKSIAILSAALVMGAVGARATEHADLLIRHVVVVDVEHGRLIDRQAVATRGEQIVAVVADDVAAAQWTARNTVDGHGGYLIPGLWDMHVHFGGGEAIVDQNQALMPLYIAYGVTTIREASGDLPYVVLRWRKQIADGKMFGPRLLTSGPKIEGIKPMWKATLESGSKADVDRAIAKLKALHVDFVKITDDTLKPDLYLYAVAQAHAAGFRVSGHVPLGTTIKAAADAGLNSIEHLDYAYHAAASNEATVAAEVAAGKLTTEQASARLDAGFDRQTAIAAFRYLAAKGVAVTPTTNSARIYDYFDQDDHAHDAFLAYIGPGVRKTYEHFADEARTATPAQIKERHAQYEHAADCLPLLQAAGVSILAGTDAAVVNPYTYPGIGLHDEIGVYVQRGLTPAQALASATRSGPAWFGFLDQYGAVEKGKKADLVLLEKNPLEDISATRGIRAVVLRGRLHDRAALDRMLAETRAKVAAWNVGSGQSGGL